MPVHAAISVLFGQMPIILHALKELARGVMRELPQEEFMLYANPTHSMVERTSEVKFVLVTCRPDVPKHLEPAAWLVRITVLLPVVEHRPWWQMCFFLCLLAQQHQQHGLARK